MKRLLWIVALCACGKHDDADNHGVRAKAKDEPAAVKAEPPPAPASGLGGLKVTVAGKPVTMTEAYIKRVGARGYQLFVTDHASSCHELMDNLFNARDGEHTLLLDLGHRLAADGTLATPVTAWYHHGDNPPGPGSKAVVTEKGETADVALDVVAGDTEAHGTLTAKQCGDDDLGKDGIPKARHPSTATLDVAGHKFVVASAIAHGDDVVLSTGPKDCSSTTFWAEAILERKGGTWTLHGTWLAEEAGNHESPDPKMKDIKIKRGAKGKSEDGPTVELQLTGKGKVGDYPVALDGTVEAIDCAK